MMASKKGRIRRVKDWEIHYRKSWHLLSRQSPVYCFGRRQT